MTLTTNIRTGRHCVFNMHVHLVFVTKYRKKIFKHVHLQHMHQIFKSVCDSFDTELVEFNGEHDHVHLLVHYTPKTTISKLTNSLKGVSSRCLRKNFHDISKYYWNGSLWSPSYFARSCGGASIEIVKQYIENQKTPA